MAKKEKDFPVDTTGGRIQFLRNSKGISRAELYDEVRPLQRDLDNDSKRKTVYNWESGETSPDYVDLAKMCDYFYCDSDYLLLRQNTPRKIFSHISAETGLTENASSTLMLMKQVDDPALKIVSALVEDGKLFTQLLLCTLRDYEEITQDSVFLKAIDMNDGAVRGITPEQAKQAELLSVYNLLCNFVDIQRGANGLD